MSDELPSRKRPLEFDDSEDEWDDDEDESEECADEEDHDGDAFERQFGNTGASASVEKLSLAEMKTRLIEFVKKTTRGRRLKAVYRYTFTVKKHRSHVNDTSRHIVVDATAMARCEGAKFASQERPNDPHFRENMKSVLITIRDKDAFQTTALARGRWKICGPHIRARAGLPNTNPSINTDISTLLSRLLESAVAFHKESDSADPLVLSKMPADSFPPWAKHIRGTGLEGDANSKPFILKALMSFIEAFDEVKGGQ